MKIGCKVKLTYPYFFNIRIANLFS